MATTNISFNDPNGLLADFPPLSDTVQAAVNYLHSEVVLGGNLDIDGSAMVNESSTGIDPPPAVADFSIDIDPNSSYLASLWWDLNIGRSLADLEGAFHLGTGGDDSLVGSDSLLNRAIAASSEQNLSLIELDSTAPTVTSFSPGDEAAGVAVSSNIVLTFSEAIARGTGLIVLKTTSGTTVASYDAATSPNLTISAGVWTLNPSADLAYGSGYRLEFAAGSITDLAGNPYAGSTSYNFSTQVVDDYAGNAATTGAVLMGASASGSIETAFDQDWFAVNLTAGYRYSFALNQAASNGLPYPYLSLFSGSGQLLAEDDDGPVDEFLNALLSYTAITTGTYYLQASAFDNEVGHYTLIANQISDPTHTAPAVSISDNLAGTANRATASIAYTLTFSETVTGLSVSDFTMSSGTVSSVSGAGTVWTVNVTPSLGVSNGSITLNLKAGAVLDAQGDSNAATSHSAQLIDTAAPVAPKLVTGTSFHSVVDPQVTLTTTLGQVVLELYPDEAPITVANMLAYVDTGFYVGTLFHRVIPNFVVQGGGLTGSVNTGLFSKTPSYGPIILESNNGLLNTRGTLAMARTNVADSATSQFFVNLVDNNFLNYSSAASPGYAVFGQVVGGMGVVDNMALQPRLAAPNDSFPATDIVITNAAQTRAGSSASNAATFTVQGLEVGAAWQYSLNGGSTWINGSGSSFATPNGNYAANAIQVRQTDAAGNQSLQAGHFTSALSVETIAPTVLSFSPVDEAIGFAVSHNIVLTFSEAIARGTGTIVLKTAVGTVIESFAAATSSQLTLSGATLTINPSADLAYSSDYKVEFAPGAIKDLAGNSYAGSTSYNFSTAPPGQSFTGTPAPDTLLGGWGNDSVSGLASDDTLTGGGGDDAMDGGLGSDTAFFTGTRASHNLSKAGANIVVADTIANRNGIDTLVNLEALRFSDMTVDLTMGAKSLTISAANLKTLEEIYVGFFNRVPEAGGMAYWIGEIASGVTMKQVADRAYDAGIQYSDLTGYTADMTTGVYITKIYANVFGRSGATAPNADEIGYWANWLTEPGHTRGNMVLQMLSDVHTHFETHPVWGWVASLLNNKAAVANYYAIEQGLSFLDAATNITFGMQVAALITPTDTTAAIELIGVNDFSML